MATSTDKNKVFFLARQSANILEDLSRQMSQPGSICLLHGKPGVGKTSLLQRFIQTRVDSLPVCALTFNPDGACQNGIGDTVNGETFRFTLNTLNELAPQTLLVVDGFQHASSTAKQQLLAYWDSDAESCKQRLIVAGQDDLIVDLRNLPLQIATEINSVELLPLSMSDRIEYLSSVLCDETWEQLVVGRELKRKLMANDGFFAALNELARVHRGNHVCRDRAERTVPIVRWSSIAVVLGIVILIATLLSEEYLPVDRQVSLANQKLETSASDNDQSAMVEPVQDRELQSEAGLTADVSVSYKPQSDLQRNAEPEMASDLPAPALPEAIEKSDISDSVETVSTAATTANTQESVLSLLQLRLAKTDDWIREKEGNAASIQIMTLTASSDPQASLGDYLQRLENQGIDVSHIYIYQLHRQDMVRYGVLFGDYPDRNAALAAINQLPQQLRSNGPIPRTIRGLRKEIARWQGDS